MVITVGLFMLSFKIQLFIGAHPSHTIAKFIRFYTFSWKSGLKTSGKYKTLKIWVGNVNYIYMNASKNKKK